MEIIGYLASVAIGISLGLIGGGGSILTVPVLVYLFHQNVSLATSYSLFIVGTTSLAGALNNYRSRLIHFPTALLFGISSVATVVATRKYILPAVPENLITIGLLVVSKNTVTMLLFAALMIAASVSMIRPAKDPGNLPQASRPRHYLQLSGYGIIIGLVTGLLGAGGGFLLIPALVLLVRLPMKTAIATSLLIIAMNSLIGFTGDIGHFSIDWKFLLTITALAVTGIAIGSALGKKTDSRKLKAGFGWFVLIMGTYIIIKELIK